MRRKPPPGKDQETRRRRSRSRRRPSSWKSSPPRSTTWTRTSAAPSPLRRSIGCPFFTLRCDARCTWKRVHSTPRKLETAAMMLRALRPLHPPSSAKNSAREPFSTTDLLIIPHSTRASKVRFSLLPCLLPLFVLFLYMSLAHKPFLAITNQTEPERQLWKNNDNYNFKN